MLLAAHVNNWFEEQMQKPAYAKRVLDYFEYYLYPTANPFEFETEGEYFDYILANDIRTLKGEAVKGLGECLIANHLFKLGVEYQYEAPYEHATRSLDFRQYQPDFYLPDYGVYIEHVGIDRNGNTAPYVDRETYHRGMEWKRELHKTHETILIETFYYEHVDGVLLKSLETKLEAAGVEFNSLPPEAVLGTLREFGAISVLADLLGQLLMRYKACHFEEDQLAFVVRNSDNPNQVAAALDLLFPIADAYEAKLADSEQIDFDDMIGRAISYVTQGRFRSGWRYILVDEFQDISEPRARLVKALRDSVSECSLFCVGDDWQAIYRFTGSDIGFTTSFQEKFGATKITALDTTFRFNNSICDVASKFVLKNPAQLRKSLSTHLKVSRPAVSIMRKRSEPTGERAGVDPRLSEVLEKISEKAPEGSTVYLLGRFGFNLPNAGILKVLRQTYPGLAISALTMHGSKGKEADFVVLLGLQSGKHGFPSKKATHPLLEALLPKLEPFDYAEERRLFYVAVTRARHRVYLICDMASASEFVVELVAEQYPVELEEFETSLAQKLFQLINCKKCETGTLVPREGKFGSFYGCSHYPLCDNAENGCRSCGNPMQRVGRFKVCINPDCASWIPTCPQCGAEMTQREGRYGNFWGCRNYRGEEQVSCSHTENSITYLRPLNDPVGG
jgi:DNA helicase-4